MDDLTGALDRAFAYQQRWYAGGDVADAEEAIRGWQAALDVPGGDWAAANCGVLLVERAYRRRDPADAVEAARLLENSATAAGDDPVAAQRWYQLGNAHFARWRLGEGPGSVQAMLRCQEAALRHNPADPDLLLLIHTGRLMAAGELFDPDDDAALVTVAGLRGVIADAMAVLDRPAVPPQRRGNLAALLALAEQRIGPYQPGGMDVPVVHDLLARIEGVDLDPAIAPVIGAVRAYAGLWASGGPTARDTDRGLAGLVAAIPEAASGQREGLEFGVAALLAGRFVHYGDLRSRDAVPQLLRRDGASDEEQSHARFGTCPG